MNEHIRISSQWMLNVETTQEVIWNDANRTLISCVRYMIRTVLNMCYVANKNDLKCNSAEAKESGFCHSSVKTTCTRSSWSSHR